MNPGLFFSTSATTWKRAARRPVVPGAIAVSLASDISVRRRKMGADLPDPEASEDMQGFGIDADSSVVVYDNASGAQADAHGGLCWAGHENVGLLDGGLAAWIAAGHNTAPDPAHAGWWLHRFSPGGMPVIDASAADIAATALSMRAASCL